MTQRTEGQYQPVNPQVSNQRSLSTTRELAIPETWNVQRETDRSNLRPDKSKILQAQGTADESNRTPSSHLRKEDKTNGDKMEKELLKEVGKVVAVISEKELLMESENCKVSGNEADLVMLANFELEATTPCVVLQNVEDGGPSMGLSKDYLRDKPGGAERNTHCEQIGPRHMGKVYSRS